MCDLLLPRRIKGLSACSVFFSINNFNQKASLKRLLKEELKQWFLLNVYVNVSDLFIDFAVHKLCRTLENAILHFAVGISRFFSCITQKYMNVCSNSIFSNAS